MTAASVTADKETGNSVLILAVIFFTVNQFFSENVNLVPKIFQKDIS